MQCVSNCTAHFMPSQRDVSSHLPAQSNAAAARAVSAALALTVLWPLQAADHSTSSLLNETLLYLKS